jgi:hypothetical protein
MTAEGEEPLNSDRRERVTDIVEAMQTKSQLKVICIASKKRKETNGECSYRIEFLHVTPSCLLISIFYVLRLVDDSVWGNEEVNSGLTLVAVIGIESTVGQQVRVFYMRTHLPSEKVREEKPLLRLTLT